MHTLLRKPFFSKTISRALSNNTWSLENGTKVSLMGTNVAKSKVLTSIEESESAVRLSAIPQKEYNSTVSAYLEKNGADIGKVR